MNNINTWLVDEDCDLDEVKDDLDELCGDLDEENENNSDPTEQCILENEVVENVDDGEEQPLNPGRQWYAPFQMKVILKRLFIWIEKEILKKMKGI